MNAKLKLNKDPVVSEINPRYIPKSLRDLVWETYGTDKCQICKTRNMSFNNFHCAHIISIDNGGQSIFDNLRPTCASCNLSMNSYNLIPWCLQFFPDSPLLVSLQTQSIDEPITETYSFINKIDKFKKFVVLTTKVPEEFINDFLNICKDIYANNEIVIDFELLYKWLGALKANLKRVLLNNFQNNLDYSIEKDSSISSTYELIKITPDCFKELCMISKTEKSKDARKYFIQMETLVKQYFDIIKENMCDN